MKYVPAVPHARRNMPHPEGGSVVVVVELARRQRPLTVGFSSLQRFVRWWHVFRSAAWSFRQARFSAFAPAQSRFDDLNAAFPGKVGLMHGRLKGVEKDKVMADFKSGALSVLVATTVIEVGVDVPNATLMVIEHADRFGLSQLHQLRGRISRGPVGGECYFFADAFNDETRDRLRLFAKTTDGFALAEQIKHSPNLAGATIMMLSSAGPSGDNTRRIKSASIKLGEKKSAPSGSHAAGMPTSLA